MPTADPNVSRLRLLIDLFGLTARQVADAGGVSRPYVARVIGGGLMPSPSFLRCVEAGLADLVANRSGQVFNIRPTIVNAAVVAAATGGMKP